MKKSEVEFESSIEIILVIIAIILGLVLITAIILNIETMGEYLKNSMGELF